MHSGFSQKTILTGMVAAAKVRLRKKVIDEGWSKGVTFKWIETSTQLPKKWCNGIARYTLLRWAVNQSP